MKSKIVAGLCMALSLSIAAQNEKPAFERCSVLSHEARLQQLNPNRKAEQEAYQKAIQNYLANNNDLKTIGSTQATITIPVVVHVVYANATQNISTAQIQSQINILTQDFTHTNPDASNTPSLFQSKVGNSNILWCLAQVDPNGNPTTGIVRKQTTQNGFIDDDKVKSSASGGDDAWPVTQYFNIWVCDLGSQLLGYGEFPTSSPSNTFGLVCNYTCFGNTGTAAAPYDLGRTSTHEVGHCLNLFHIWGDEPACAADDGITDTPKQKGENYGVPTFPQGTSATGGCCVASDQSSMFMNYMDYTDDAGMNMFTAGQVTTMLAVLNTAPYNALTTSNKCTATTGIYSIAQNNLLDVYPNPGSGLFTLTLRNGNAENSSVILTNSLGEVVEKATWPAGITQHSLDLSALPAGIYFVECMNDGYLYRKKIILERGN